MDNSQIVSAIRSLAKGYDADIDISGILLVHGCFFLLSKLKNENENVDFARRITAANLLTIKDRFKGCESVFNCLNQTNYAVIKGAILSKAAYGNVCYRRSSDIDLLVSRENLDFVKNTLLQNGFIQGRIIDGDIVPFSRQEILYHTALSHQTAPFLKKTGSRFCPVINIDVNIDVMWGESQKQTDMDKFLLNTEVAEVCCVELKKLSPIAEFISLCLHHYKDMNSIYLLSQGSLRLSLFCDIYFYFINNSIDITGLKHMCQALDVTKYVYYCINATNEIFADERLCPYLCALASNKDNTLKNSFGLDTVEQKEWNIDLHSRLFNDNFKDAFFSLLSARDLEKIDINKKYMI